MGLTNVCGNRNVNIGSEQTPCIRNQTCPYNGLFPKDLPLTVEKRRGVGDLGYDPKAVARLPD